MSDMKQGSTIKFKKLDVPFDLDAVVQITYSTAGLKSVLEFLIDHIGELKQMHADGEDMVAAL